jgi:hypothetical protein
MSLEGLPATQVQQLASGMQALLSCPDAEVRKGAQRLLKKVDPKLNFPELEAEDQIATQLAAIRKENEDLRNNLKERDFTADVREQHKRVVSRGFKVEDVQKFMTERGIVNFDTAMNVLDMEQRLAAPTPEAMAGNYDLPEESKDIFKNPAQWARKTAHNLITGFMAKQRA